VVLEIDPDTFHPFACGPILPKPKTLDDKEDPFVADVHAGAGNLKSGDLTLLRLN
jgi:hypothetical protein